MSKSGSYETIAYANIKIDEFVQYMNTEDGIGFIDRNWSEARSRDVLRIPWDDEKNIGFCSYQGIVPYLSENNDHLYSSTWRSSYLEDLVDCNSYIESMNQMWDVVYIDEKQRFASIRYGDRHKYIIPYQFLNIHHFKNYDDLSISEARLLSGQHQESPFLPKSVQDVSINQQKSKIEETKQQIEETSTEILAAQKEKEAEIEKIKAEIEAKYADMLSELNKKTAELNDMKASLENQLFMLESQIYAIRCYTGEVINFTCLMSGKRLDIEEPLIINQKIRFLDEELAKACSMYSFDGDAACLESFETILKNREDIRELFVPQPKCVAFIKVSKSGQVYGSSDILNNALQAYEKYHGSTIGILIQDGDNLFIGWTDEEKIKLNDENAFYKRYEESHQVGDTNNYDSSSSREDVVSRYFIFSILQGLVDSHNIICIPEAASLMKPSRYIQWSTADNWINDNRFGTLADILKKTQVDDIRLQDMILTTMHVSRDDYGYGRDSSMFRPYCNDRGRGIANRTHDASVSDATIFSINCIDTTVTYEVSELVYPLYTKDDSTIIMGPPKLEVTDFGVENGMRGSYKIQTCEDARYYHSIMYDKETGGSYTETHDVTVSDVSRNYFVSVAKTENWETGKSARCNFQVYPDEYINLTFLNTVWLKYVMMNKNTGGARIGHANVDFAYVAKYLNIAIKYLSKREETEAKLIEAAGYKLWNEWQVDLSEWKLANNIHTLTATRAKKFARSHYETK